jgi:hypothetical protein
MGGEANVIAGREPYKHGFQSMFTANANLTIFVRL